MKIAIDAMGGDNAPLEIIKGTIKANEILGRKVSFYLVGNEEKIYRLIENNNLNINDNITLIDAKETISNDEQPIKAIRSKKNSSLVKGLNLIKEKESDGFISAGSTGAFLAGSLFIVGRINGIDRPALGSIIPTKKNSTLILDIGANTECKPKNIKQFALMGNVYMNKILQKQNPKIGLLNIGIEPEKGNFLTKDSFKILNQLDYINFVGNYEARDILEGKVDVLVCDGFTGNILLKSVEGVATTVFDIIKTEIKSSFISKIGGLILKSRLVNMKKTYDYTEYGGAPFIGVDGNCVKCHGSSDAKAIKNAILQTVNLIENKIVDRIKDDIEKGEI